MNCKEIIEKYLRENGYEALCGDGCGCGLDDFAPCGNPLDCVPGYKVAKPEELKKEFGEFMYWPKREPPNAKEFEDLY